MSSEVVTGPFITRQARREDHPEFVRFWAELGLDKEAPDVEEWDAHLRPATIFLEAPGGVLAAYALTFAFGTRGDVRQIVVAPAFRGQRVGRQLMAAVAERFRAGSFRCAPSISIMRRICSQPRARSASETRSRCCSSTRS